MLTEIEGIWEGTAGLDLSLQTGSRLLRRSDLELQPP